MTKPEPDPQYVSQTAFGQVLNLLHENREAIRAQVSGLSAQLTTLGVEIKSKQDITNGRVRKAEEDIGTMRVGLEAVEEDVAIIKAKGCPLRDQHVQALAVLSAAGVVPAAPDAPTGAPWQTTAKRVGKVGSWMGGGAILVKILEVAQAWFQHAR